MNRVIYFLTFTSPLLAALAAGLFLADSEWTYAFAFGVLSVTQQFTFWSTRE